VIRASTIKQKIGGSYYIFDEQQCAIILKRLHSIYGNDFCSMFRNQ